ncbi:PRA1 family protein B4-like protein [Tanacetum coccineum]
MSSSPVILPITNQTSESQALVAPLAFCKFINNIRETVKSSLLTHCPCSDLNNRSAFSKPDSITNAASRIRKNYSYDNVNYITIIALVLGFSLLTIVGSVLILALMIVAAVVLAHGTFRIPEDLFLDEQYPAASTGFFVFP